jgi:lambda family phage portal protein
VRVITNNVIGTGIGMQAQVVNARGKLQTSINDSIEQAFNDWSDKKICHTAGVLGFADIERYAMFQLPTAGEVLLRKWRQPFGDSKIPFALEVIEADRLLDNWQTARAPNGNAIRLGIEVDGWMRPVAYWLHPRHPGDYQFMSFDPSKFVRVPAEDMIHLYIVDRWPQMRGEPWFHTVIKDLHHTSGLEEAVVVKARASANIVGFIRAPEPLTPDETKAGRQLIDTEPGTWQRLLPGEEVSGFNAATPDPAVEPFLRYMTRKMAVGVGLSYEALSRDYTNATYSSARMGLLDDRDVYRVLQGFICRNLRAEVHREWLDAAALVGAVKVGTDYFTNPKKYQKVRYKPRGWSWIDPTKEVQAYKTAVRNGFMTQTDVVAQTANGVDIEDVFKARRAELDLAADYELVFDSDPLQVNDKGQTQPLPPADEADAADPNATDEPKGEASADVSTGGEGDGADNSKSENQQ